jgi:hypothetical protein
LRTLLRGALVASAFFVLQAAPALASAPPNDDFDNATVVSALPFSDSEDVSEATRAADDPYSSFWPNVWYRFTPATDTSLEVDTAGSNTDTDACLYTGTRGALAPVACSPDGFDSHFFAELKAGVTYHLMVDITSGCCGQTLTLALRDRTVGNDDFDSAQQVGSLPYDDSRDVLRASTAPDDPWCLTSSTNTVWYRYTPSVDLAVAADTAGSDYDTRLCVYSGSRGALNELASNDDANNTVFAALTVNLQADTTYWFMVATNQPDASNLHLSLQETSLLPRVANDDFDSATQIATASYSDTLDASRATAAADDPSDCYGSHGSVWYAFTPSISGNVEISTAGSDYDTALGVYTGQRGALSQVACDNDSDPALTSHVSFQASAGTTYYVMAVAAWSLAPRTLQLSLSLTPPPPPLTLALSYDPQAVVDGLLGTAVVTGTIGCSRSAKATITVSVGQQLGNSAPRTGAGKATVSCSTKATTRFSIAVASTSSPGLSDGPASVRLVATGCDATRCTKTTSGGDLQLVKKLK